jgi:hypothetical protein
MSIGDGTLLDGVDELVAALRTDSSAAGGFEELAGPLDRLANTLGQVSLLLQLATSEQRETLTELAANLRGLYKRVVGVVLENVMDHAGQEGSKENVYAVAEHLVRETVRQGDLDVFVLNYDALLDSALLEQVSPTPSRRDFDLSDEFLGYDFVDLKVIAESGEFATISCMQWRNIGYFPPRPHLRLHHLHGAGTWMRYKGNVYKARHVSWMREHGIFTAWAEGIEGASDDDIEPVVLLGDQKEAHVLRPPFIESYEALAHAVRGANEIVLAGVSLQDVPLNRTIARNRDADSKVIVLNPDPGIEQTARAALGPFDQGQLEVRSAYLPYGLPA